MTDHRLPDFVERMLAGERVFLPHATHEDIRFAGPLYNRVKARGQFVHFAQAEIDGTPGLEGWVDDTSGLGRRRGQGLTKRLSDSAIGRGPA